MYIFSSCSEYQTVELFEIGKNDEQRLRLISYNFTISIIPPIRLIPLQLLFLKLHLLSLLNEEQTRLQNFERSIFYSM